MSRSTVRASRILVLVLWSVACLCSALLAVRNLKYWYAPWHLGCELDDSAPFKTVVLVTLFAVPLLLLITLLSTLVFLCCACCPNRFDARASLIVELGILFSLTVAPTVVLKLVRQYGGGTPEWTAALDSSLYTVFVVLRPVVYTRACSAFKEHLLNKLCCGRRRVGSHESYSTVQT